MTWKIIIWIKIPLKSFNLWYLFFHRNENLSRLVRAIIACVLFTLPVIHFEISKTTLACLYSSFVFFFGAKKLAGINFIGNCSLSSSWFTSSIKNHHELITLITLWFEFCKPIQFDVFFSLCSSQTVNAFLGKLNSLCVYYRKNKPFLGSHRIT